MAWLRYVAWLIGSIDLLGDEAGPQHQSGLQVRHCVVAEDEAQHGLGAPMLRWDVVALLGRREGLTGDPALFQEAGHHLLPIHCPEGRVEAAKML
jgi:hypothetical protein